MSKKNEGTETASGAVCVTDVPSAGENKELQHNTTEAQLV